MERPIQVADIREYTWGHYRSGDIWYCAANPWWQTEAYPYWWNAYSFRDVVLCRLWSKALSGKEQEAGHTSRNISYVLHTVKSKGGCSSHQIHNVQVEEILLRELHRIIAYAREHESEFIELVTKQSENDLNRRLRDSHKELEQATELQSWTLSFKDFMKIIVMARVLMNVLQECQQPKILNRNS